MTTPTPDEICERLLTLAADCEIGESNYCIELADAAKEAGTTLRDLIQQQRAEIERLSAALEPFADRLNTLETNCRKLNCGVPGETNVRTAWLREARAALGKDAKE